MQRSDAPAFSKQKRDCLEPELSEKNKWAFVERSKMTHSLGSLKLTQAF